MRVRGTMLPGRSPSRRITMNSAARSTYDCRPEQKRGQGCERERHAVIHRARGFRCSAACSSKCHSRNRWGRDEGNRFRFRSAGTERDRIRRKGSRHGWTDERNSSLRFRFRPASGSAPARAFRWRGTRRPESLAHIQRQGTLARFQNSAGTGMEALTPQQMAWAAMFVSPS